MSTYLKPAAVMLLLLTLITGVIYPLVVTAIAQVIFSDQANGSLLKNKQGEAIGSSLIGQTFSQPQYFWSRPSATSPYSYNASASSGSNLGPTNPALTDAINARIVALKEVDPDNKAPVPVDLITASASGLDPHISLAAADYQVKRIAKIRKLDEHKVRELVAANSQDRQWAIFGEPRVNVLSLNLALDQLNH